MNTSSLPFDLRDGVRQLIAYDDSRTSLPLEHTATLAAGASLISCAFLTPRRPAAVVLAVLAGALLFRAAAGRDGLRAWANAPAARPLD